MKYSLVDLLEQDERFTVDPRARSREKSTPGFTNVMRVKSYREALEKAASVDRSPSVIIKTNGQATLFNAGGSATIWFCSEDGEMSDAQTETLNVVLQALQNLGAVLSFSKPYEEVR